MKIYQTILILFLASLPLLLFAQDEQLFSSGEIYVKLSHPLAKDHQHHFLLDSDLAKLFAANSIDRIRQVFPEIRAVDLLPGMENIYRIKLHNPDLLEKTLNNLSASPDVEYAEPVPVRQLFDIPNDPFWNSQYHLALLQVDSARDIHSGDPGVAIAVIDGGVNYLHPDLRPDIWVNAAEDVDGDGFLSPADNDSTDADGNGFIDDVIGWDFVNIPGQGFAGEDDSLADNDPMDFGGHGTHCAGDAAAATNNGIGIASVGGNSNIMCVRAGMTASNGMGYIYYSVEGIYYAAANGARVISMSYGGSTPSNTEQLAIDFAYNRGVVCVAAAGNDNSNSPQYPANYNHVIAVAATNQDDHKADFSNYGSWIDVSAPGVDIYSTTPGGYGNMSGTSMATPIVAGLAGLTAAMFPTYLADQLVERIQSNCDSIDHLNPIYAGQLGAGRVNAFRTLDKVVRVLKYSVIDTATGNGNGRLDFGENAGLVLTLKNTYEPVTNVTVTLHSNTAALTFQDSIAGFGNLALQDTARNPGDPFALSVASDSSLTAVEIKVEVTADGGYQYQKILKLPVGQRDILVVNDDEPTGSTKIGYYADALDSLQRNYDVWDVRQQGLPGAAEQNYRIIIWYTGEATQNVLTAGEQQFLQDFLDDGGKLFLTGQNIGYDLVEQQNGAAFFQNYLHAGYVQDDANDFALSGLPNDPISAGQQFIILGSGGANNQDSPDIITAESPAQASIVYDLQNPDNQAALSFNGFYQLVYFSFGWEGINDQGEAKRHEVMRRVLDWLEQPTGILDFSRHPIPVTAQLYPNFPNPFNPETIISFSLPGFEEVRIEIFNTLGEKVRGLLNAKLAGGFHEIKWNGLDDAGRSCASGVYYLQFRTKQFLQTQKLLLLR